MKIEPFKMKVTPEQSKRVQEILLKNGYSWFITGTTNIKHLDSPYLYFTQSIILGETQPTLTRGDLEFTFYENNTPEITYQEFIDKYEFELPERWCIKINSDNIDTIKKWIHSRPDFDSDYLVRMRGFALSDCNTDKSYQHWSSNKPSEYIEITFEQFKKYVLKEETMDKKIIGYKLIKPEYKEAINRIILSADYLQVGSTAEKKLREAGVLDLWFEPVYEEEENFNVGDWVTYIKERIPPYTTQIQSIGNDGWIYSNINKPHYHYSQYRKATSDEIKKATKYKIGDWITIEDSSELQPGCKGCPEGTFQVLSPTLDWEGLCQYDNGFFVKASNGIWKISNIGVRKATPEEIEDAQVVKMPFGDIEVVVDPHSVVYTPEAFKIPFKDIRDLLAHWDYEMSAGAPHCYRIFIADEAIIQVGCMKGTFKQLLDIYSKMRELRYET